MTPQQMLRVTWAWRWLALLVWVATVLITLAVSLVLPKSYTASTLLYADLKADPILGTVLPGVASPTYMTTQTEIIRSDRVAMQVVKMLRLGEVPSVVESWTKETDGQIPIEQYYGKLLLKGLVVKPAPGSNLIDLSFNSSDARFAAAAANAFAQAALETNIELRANPAREYAVWFDERMKTLRVNLEKAQAALSAYQQKSGIAASDERLDQEMARLVALNSDLSAVLAQRADLTSREKNAESDVSPDVMRSPMVQQLRAEVSKTETALSEIGSSVGRNHPVRKQLEAQLVTQRQQLASEVDRVSSSVSSASRVSAQKEAELRAAIATQKNRVLELREEHDRIAVLRDDVERARRALEGVSQRMSQTNLESQSQLSNLIVLNPAVIPLEPSRPRILVNVLVSVVGGLLFGLGAAIARESIDRRVRHRDDLAELQGVPLLGVLRSEPSMSRFRARWGGAVRWIVRGTGRPAPTAATP